MTRTQMHHEPASTSNPVPLRSGHVEDRRNDRSSSTASEASLLLRHLAKRAMGLSGADIERIVRQARSRARRSKRDLQLKDIVEGLRGQRPVLPDAIRWRYAVHEAGHAVVHHVLGLGAVEGITIDAATGGLNTMSFAKPDESLAWYGQMLAMVMAGRAAELLVIGNASTGSGGSEKSDLAKATELALTMETRLGFGGTRPLLYLAHEQPAQVLTFDAALAARVHGRIEAAAKAATDCLTENRRTLDTLAESLFRQSVLDAEDVERILDQAAREHVEPSASLA